MATLEQLENRIAKLQEQADQLRRKHAADVISTVKELMAAYGLTVADLGASTTPSTAPLKGAFGKGSRQNARAVQTVPGKGKLPPKYLNPATGETWSGHARPPAWIKDVADRSKYLIGSGEGTQLQRGVTQSGLPTGSPVPKRRGRPPKVVAV